jgi:hypothetical protein
LSDLPTSSNFHYIKALAESVYLVYDDNTFGLTFDPSVVFRVDLDSPVTEELASATESINTPVASKGAADATLAILVSVFVVIFMVIIAACVFVGRKYLKVESKFFGNTTITEFPVKQNRDAGSNVSVTVSPSNMGLAIPAYKLVESQAFFLTKKINKGGFGEIWLAEANKHSLQKYGDKIIVKILAPNYNDLNSFQQRAFDQEVAISESLSEESNFIKFLGFCHYPCAILTKFYREGSLGTWIYQKPRILTKRLIAKFSRDIAIGLNLMSETGLSHCDIKPANILIDKHKTKNSFRAVICDFGLTQVLKEEAKASKMFMVSNTRGLSFNYASPELFLRFKQKVEGTKVLEKSDIFSFAMTLFEMLLVKIPWGKPKSTKSSSTTVKLE